MRKTIVYGIMAVMLLSLVSAGNPLIGVGAMSFPIEYGDVIKGETYKAYMNFQVIDKVNCEWSHSDDDCHTKTLVEITNPYYAIPDVKTGWYQNSQIYKFNVSLTVPLNDTLGLHTFQVCAIARELSLDEEPVEGTGLSINTGACANLEYNVVKKIKKNNKAPKIKKIKYKITKVK